MLEECGANFWTVSPVECCCPLSRPCFLLLFYACQDPVFPTLTFCSYARSSLLNFFCVGCHSPQYYFKMLLMFHVRRCARAACILSFIFNSAPWGSLCMCVWLDPADTPTRFIQHSGGMEQIPGTDAART